MTACCHDYSTTCLQGMEIVFRIGVALLLLGEADLLCMDMEGMLMVSSKGGGVGCSYEV